MSFLKNSIPVQMCKKYQPRYCESVRANAEARHLEAIIIWDSFSTEVWSAFVNLDHPFDFTQWKVCSAFESTSSPSTPAAF